MKRILTTATALLLVLAPVHAAESTVEAVPADSAVVAEVLADEAGPAGAHETVAAASVLPSGDALPDTTGLVTRMALSLLTVVVLIWGVVQLLKRFGPGGTGAASGRHIRVLDRAYIAPKKSIYVVQIGEKAMAVGVSDAQITPLTDLDLDETLARYAEPETARPVQRFTDVMRTVNARFARRAEEPAT